MNPRQQLDLQLRQARKDREDRQALIGFGVIVLLAVLTFIATR